MPSQVVGEKIRRAVAGDLDAVVAIERVSFSDPPWSRSSFAALLDDPQVQFLVATVSDADPGLVGGSGRAISGYAVTWVVFDQADLSNLAVAPGLRRRGIGRRLLEAAIVGATREGARALFLEVRESNAVALRLYASRGFSPVGRRRGYYRQPAEDALVLRLDLTPPARGGSGAAP